MTVLTFTHPVEQLDAVGVVGIWQEKSLAWTVEWLSKIGLINWSSSQKLDGQAQLLSLLFSILNSQMYSKSLMDFFVK